MVRIWEILKKSTSPFSKDNRGTSDRFPIFFPFCLPLLFLLTSLPFFSPIQINELWNNAERLAKIECGFFCYSSLYLLILSPQFILLSLSSALLLSLSPLPPFRSLHILSPSNYSVVVLVEPSRSTFPKR